MYRGTTPTLNFKLPFDSSAIAALSIAFSQNNEVVIEKTKIDCSIEQENISTKLSQYDTLLFDAKHIVEIQVRIRTVDGNALASNIIKVPVNKILKDGEI